MMHELKLCESMPFPRFVVSPPGSLSSQRIAKLEERRSKLEQENAWLRLEVALLRKRIEEQAERSPDGEGDD